MLTELPSNFTIGKSVKNMQGTFYNCGNLKVLSDAFALPENIENIAEIFFGCGNLKKLPENFMIPIKCTIIRGAFFNCHKLSGSIIIDTTPTSYEACFWYTNSKGDEDLIVNYTENCSNIDEILSSGAAYVTKGALK